MAQILLTGSSGLIGTALVRAIGQDRIATITLTRDVSSKASEVERRQQLPWDPYSATPVSDPRALDGVTAAVHLSGANVAGARWTTAYKRKIMESRTQPTHALATLLTTLKPLPQVLVCASAIGIYGDRGDELLDEDAQPGSGFLPEVCLAWEAATKPASDAGIRVVHARFGVVLSPRGGALAKMLPVFRMGLGGKLGGGKQWMSWIALQDAVRAILFALQTSGLSGAVNVVAPNPSTNLAFTHALGQAVHRPTLLPVPAFALKAAFGEMAEASVLASARVVCTRLSTAGFSFDYPELPSALQALLQGS